MPSSDPMSREPPPRRDLLVEGMAALLLVGCVANEDDSAPIVTPFEDAALDVYTLGMEPDPSSVVELLGQDVHPVVMVNLLHFREEAAGEGFAGMTGREAYEQYIAAIGETQDEIGSRLIWGADVDAQVVGSSDPVFHTVALLEYVDVQAFVGFGRALTSEASDARAAGLEGQWLLAARTVSEDDGALGLGEGCGSWTAEQASASTGLSDDQVGRLFGGPDGPVGVVELFREGDSGDGLDTYLAATRTVQEELGGRRRWSGELVQMLIGAAEPSFDLMVVSEYPSVACYLATLSDQRVTSLSDRRAETEQHWVYATSGDGLGELER